jgi:hypothetical protein
MKSKKEQIEGLKKEIDYFDIITTGLCDAKLNFVFDVNIDKFNKVFPKILNHISSRQDSTGDGRGFGMVKSNTSDLLGDCNKDVVGSERLSSKVLGEYYKFIEEWITNPERQSPQFVFTDSPERRLAYLILENFVPIHSRQDVERALEKKGKKDSGDCKKT